MEEKYLFVEKKKKDENIFLQRRRKTEKDKEEENMFFLLRRRNPGKERGEIFGIFFAEVKKKRQGKGGRIICKRWSIQMILCKTQVHPDDRLQEDSPCK